MYICDQEAVCTSVRPTEEKLRSGNIEGSERSASLAAIAVTRSTRYLAVELSMATTLINRDVLHKLIAQWRTANSSIVMVEADIREGRAIIRIGVERVTRKFVRDLPCDIEGFPVVVEEQSRQALQWLSRDDVSEQFLALND
jgi:hypothetical protein